MNLNGVCAADGCANTDLVMNDRPVDINYYERPTDVNWRHSTWIQHSVYEFRERNVLNTNLHFCRYHYEKIMFMKFGTNTTLSMLETPIILNGTSLNTSLYETPTTSGLEPISQFHFEKRQLCDKIEHLEKVLNITNTMIDYEAISQIVGELPVSDLKDILATEIIGNPGEDQYFRQYLLDKLRGLQTLIPLVRKVMEIYSKLQYNPSQQEVMPILSPQTLQPSTLTSPIYNEVLSSPTFELSQRFPADDSLEYFRSDSIDLFKHLPFYKKLETIMEPTLLTTNPDCSFSYENYYNITHEIRKSVNKSVLNIFKQEYKLQIVLRFVQLHNICDNEHDVTERLPYGLSVMVNDKQCTLPTLNIPTNPCSTPWHCNMPIDITQETLMFVPDSSLIKILWLSEPCSYLAGIYLVEKLTIEELLEELKKKPFRPYDITKELIKNLFDADDIDTNVNSVIFTLQDPLSKIRMELPTRGVHCTHLQCFDAKTFLQMNEGKQTWACPLCKKVVKCEDIEVDEFFLNIVESPNLSEKCKNVVFLPGGTWTERNINELSSSETQTNGSESQMEVITLSDDDDHEVSQPAKCTKDIPSKERGPRIKIEYKTKTTNLQKSNDNLVIADLNINVTGSIPLTSSEDQPIMTENECIASTSKGIPSDLPNLSKKKKRRMSKRLIAGKDSKRKGKFTL